MSKTHWPKGSSLTNFTLIVPCGRHFHPSASNCCYCNRKSVKICAICGSINLKRYFLKNIIPTDEIVPTDELSSHRLHTQIIFHAEEHGLFRTRINRIERIFHPDHIYARLYYTACLSMLNRLYSCRYSFITMASPSGAIPICIFCSSSMVLPSASFFLHFAVILSTIQ